MHNKRATACAELEQADLRFPDEVRSVAGSNVMKIVKVQDAWIREGQREEAELYPEHLRLVTARAVAASREVSVARITHAQLCRLAHAVTLA